MHGHLAAPERDQAGALERGQEAAGALARGARSACFSLYDASVAPSIALQAFPSLSQRCHLYEYVIGWSPVQVPVVVFRV